jgi:hypothetical protein
MKSIHGKAFLDLWQALYHESSPGPTADRWHLDGVDWVRETYRIGTRDYGFHVDAHVLTHAGEKAAAWSLLVVVERWWRSGAHDPLKTSQWCRVLAGQDKQVLAWFERHRARLDARFSDKRSSVAGQAGN